MFEVFLACLWWVLIVTHMVLTVLYILLRDKRTIFAVWAIKVSFLSLLIGIFMLFWTDTRPSLLLGIGKFVLSIGMYLVVKEPKKIKKRKVEIKNGHI